MNRRGALRERKGLVKTKECIKIAINLILLYYLKCLSAPLLDKAFLHLKENLFRFSIHTVSFSISMVMYFPSLTLLNKEIHDVLCKPHEV